MFKGQLIYIQFKLYVLQFDSLHVSWVQAQQLNKDIFETIYYHALKASCELAAKEGPYETYIGSPVSKVILSERCLFPYRSSLMSQAQLVHL
jgi:hypothetical protein